MSEPQRRNVRLYAALRDWRDLALRQLWLAATAIPAPVQAQTLRLVADLLERKAAWREVCAEVQNLHETAAGVEPEPAPGLGEKRAIEAFKRHAKQMRERLAASRDSAAVSPSSAKPAPVEPAPSTAPSALKFEAELNRLKRIFAVSSKAALADALGLGRSAITLWGSRGGIPEKYRPLLAETTREGARRVLADIASSDLPPGMRLIREDEA